MRKFIADFPVFSKASAAFLITSLELSFCNTKVRDSIALASPILPKAKAACDLIFSFESNKKSIRGRVYLKISTANGIYLDFNNKPSYSNILKGLSF